MLKNKKATFFCFSPPVMLATFLIEIILFVLTLLFYKRTTKTKLIAAMLFFLAFFQLAEYFVCGGFGVGAELWSRLGFVAITTLPPLGLHLVHALAGKKAGRLVMAGYGLMAVWIAFFAFSQNAFASHACVSNYVIFNLDVVASYFYTAYYYGLLLLGMWLAFRFSQQTKQKAVKASLHGITIGYLTFLLPTAVANTIDQSTMAGIPSIMCGFAVLFALILYFYILPRTSKRK